MYTPAPQVSVPPISQSPPLSLENIRKINPKFKVNSPETCSHVTGDTPQSVAKDWLRRTAIVWHTLNTGVEFGICLNCQHQFWPDDPDYSKWRSEKSHCYPSSAINDDPVIPEEVPSNLYVNTEKEMIGDFDIILFGPDAPQIIMRGKEAQ